MKKIDELLDDFDLPSENIDINKTIIQEEEMNRIKNLTLSKANLQNKKHIRKRFIIPLAATMTVILSFAVVFAQGGLSSIYYNLFGQNIKYVNEMGTVIDKSYSENGITFNVASMLGDENSFYIIFELIKENGESFKQSEIEFEMLRLDFNSSGGYTWYQIDDDDSSDNKATFILIGNTENKTVGKKLNLSIKDLTEYSITEPENMLNVYEFLSENNDYLHQVLIENTNKSAMLEPIEENISAEEKEKIEYMNNIIPSYILPVKYSNILNNSDNNIYIDNISFVEEKLCMRILREDSDSHSIGDVYFESKSNTQDILHSDFVFSEVYEGLDYDYYIFNIRNMEDLKKYDFKYNVVNGLSTTNGEWAVTFKADYKNTTKTVNVNKKIEMQGISYIVRNVKISPLSLSVKLISNILVNSENSNYNLQDSVNVIMKDGSTVEIVSSGVSTNPLSSTINLIFKQPVDLEKIDVVVVSDIEIQVQ